MEMKAFVVSILICACLAHNEHPDEKLSSKTAEDRWFNNFHGPTLYFGSHIQLGQRERHQVGGYDHSYQHNDRRHHHRYVKQEACECVYVIEKSRSTTESTDKITTETVETTDSAGRFVERNPIPSYVLSGLKSELVDFHKGGFGFLQHGTDHEYGGLSDFGDDDFISASSEETDDTQEDVNSSGRNSPNKKPHTFVAHVPIAEDKYIRYRRQTGFRNPFTGHCVCPSAPHPTPQENVHEKSSTPTTKRSDVIVASSLSPRTHSPVKPSPATDAKTITFVTLPPPTSAIPYSTITNRPTAALTVTPETATPSLTPTSAPTRPTIASSQSTQSSGTSVTKTAPTLTPFYTTSSPKTSPTDTSPRQTTASATPPVTFSRQTTKSTGCTATPIPVTPSTTTTTPIRPTMASSQTTQSSGTSVTITAPTLTPFYTTSSPKTSPTGTSSRQTTASATPPVTFSRQTTKSTGCTATPIPATPSTTTTAPPKPTSCSGSSVTPSRLPSSEPPVTLPAGTTSKGSTVRTQSTRTSSPPTIFTITPTRAPTRTWHWYANTNGY